MIKRLLIVLLPWKLRRLALNSWLKYNIDKTAYIGFAWIFPRYLSMAPGARIDHFSVALHLDEIVLGENTRIGRSNWITGFPAGTASRHFQHQTNRTSSLKIGRESAITKKHHLDCTNSLEIGDFTTVAGYNSQLLTHSISLEDNRQDSKPIHIGNYCFIGTNVVILGGSSLPDYSVLGAKSLLNARFNTSHFLYAGVPAKAIKPLPRDLNYFNRKQGFVY
jgi:acetyltransferase-like isoleucine patch superfamily enzyme